MMFKNICLLLAVSVVLNLSAGPALAIEQQTHGTEKTEHPLMQKSSSSDANSPHKTEDSSSAAFSDKCAFIFKDFVSDKGTVDYKQLKRKKLDLNKLFDDLRNFDPNEYKKWSKENKMAFWINVYNLEMLRIIVDNYPIESTRILRIIWPPDSIRHINGIWDQYKFIVMDEEFTLQEVDQRFFREKFDEPRVFLAITYASLSSPPLRNESYYGYKLNEQLNDQAKKFLANPLAFKLDRETQKVYLSAIFEPSWYGQYFIKKYGTDKKFKNQQPAVRAVLNFITGYIPEPDVRFLETTNYTVEFMNYNWRLNE
jgi:hypothetical protein